MSASESTRIQVNFKTPDGTLINLYAVDKEELESLLTTAQDFSALITSVSKSLSGSGNAAPVSYSAGAGKGVAPAYEPPAPAAPAQAPACAHGTMTFIKGVNARGPWAGYKCPAPNGTPGKCKTIFN